MLKLKILTFFIFIACIGLSQINVGPAINNLNSRVFTLENKTLTYQEVADLGFITNELDLIALNKIGNLSVLTTTEKTNLVLAVNEVNGKASYPFRLYGGSQTNNWIEFSGTNIQIFLNSVYSSNIATTNDINNVLQLIDHFSARKVSTTSFLSVYSNEVNVVSSGLAGIVFTEPEAYIDKESKLTIHLYKSSGNVTWFSNINWIYGEEPQFEITNKTYVIQFISLNGINWNGFVEYVY